jgi:AraC family transcriptional regulator, regulatory protein of adaptative response / methylated-DNA-[protein]-cysteine methyltransferase
VPVAQAGSPFEAAAWAALRRIPAGETRSYGDLARALGRPTAARAVARANGANQVALVVPCHRVIGADGSLTGYGGKLWRKQWLLEHEHRASARPVRLPETRARA